MKSHTFKPTYGGTINDAYRYAQDAETTVGLDDYGSALHVQLQVAVNALRLAHHLNENVISSLNDEIARKLMP